MTSDNSTLSRQERIARALELFHHNSSLSEKYQSGSGYDNGR
jgi:hypothetical protein